MRIDSFFTAGLCGLLLWAAGSTTSAQFPEPPRLRFEDKGTLEVVHSDVMQIRDSKSEAWLLSIGRDTKITVEGMAERECLRPGVFVKFTAEIDKKGSLKKPLAEIEITSAPGRGSLGLFPADDKADPKPLKALAAGSYVIKGKLASLKDGDLLVMAGRHKISGEVSKDELAVKLTTDDVSLAQAGDEVKVSAYYFDASRPNQTLARPGKAVAEEITITLAKPLSAGGRKFRQTERPAKATSRSKVSK